MQWEGGMPHSKFCPAGKNDYKIRGQNEFSTILQAAGLGSEKLPPSDLQSARTLVASEGGRFIYSR